MVADDEHVAIAHTLTDTHQGDFHGIAPTERRIEIRGVQIGRFEDGKIVERWGASDNGIVGGRSRGRASRRRNRAPRRIVGASARRDRCQVRAPSRASS